MATRRPSSPPSLLVDTLRQIPKKTLVILISDLPLSGWASLVKPFDHVLPIDIQPISYGNRPLRPSPSPKLAAR